MDEGVGEQGPDKEFNFGQYEAILSLEEGADLNFAKLLESSGKGRLTILYKNLKHIIEDVEDTEAKGKYLYVILKAVTELTVAVNRLDRDELRDLVHGFLTEARHYPTEILTSFAEDCLDHLKSNVDCNSSPEWVEIFGRVVGLLSKRGSIEFENDRHTGKQFKSEMIYAILRIKWTSQNAPSLVASLREIGIEDARLLLEKVSTSLDLLEPNCVPPLTYQLLSAIGDTPRVSEFITIMDGYFDKMPTDVRETGKKCKVLGTVVFHFAQATKVMPNLRSEMLRRVKCASPEMVTKRFSLGVSLCLTQFEDIRPMVVAGLKSAITKGFIDSKLQKDTYWYQTSYESPVPDPTECFEAILQSKSSELEFMLEGFKELAVGIVSLEEKDGFVREKCRALTSLILISVHRVSKADFGSVAIQLLRNKNLASIECLSDLIKYEPRTLPYTSNMSKIYELIHQLPLLPLELSVPMIKALLPALELSHQIMGETLLIFRKSLWKSMESRRVSVSTMMVLLSKLQIKCAPPDSISQRNFMADTQATCHNFPPTPETVTMNQLLCSEIVSILGRFFSHGELRNYIYLGLESVLLKNVDLISVISGQLLNCLKYHMTDDGKTLAVYSVFQSSQEEESGPFSVMEDLGLLFQAICAMIRITEREYENRDRAWPNSVLRCQKLIDAAAADILTYDLEKFESCAEGLRNFGGTGIESVRYGRNVLIDQWMQMLEALIEHVLRGGRLNPDLDITTLFEKFQALQKLLKEIGISAQKKEKAKKGKKQNGMDAADASANSSSTKGAKVKLETVRKVVHTHIVTLESVRYILESLYKDKEDLSPDGPPFRSVQNTSFEDFLFRIIEQKLSKLNRNESIKEFDHGKKFLIKTLLLIVRSLLIRTSRCIGSLGSGEGGSSDFWNDDDVVLLEMDKGSATNNRRLQLIDEILQFIDKHGEYRHRIMKFMSLETKSDYETDFRDFYRGDWFTLFTEFKGGDVNMKGLEILLSVLSTLLTQLLPASQMADQVWDDLEHWMQLKEKLNDSPTLCLAENIIKCLVVVRGKIPQQSDMLIDLAKDTRLRLGSNGDEVEAANPANRTWLTTEDAGPAVVKVLSLWAENMLGLANSVVSRIKSRSTFVLKDSVCKWFDHCITLLTEVMRVLMELVACNFPRGICGDILLRVSTQFFNTVTDLADEICQFATAEDGNSFNLSTFKRFVKSIGRDFKQRMDCCVQYIELIEREEACEVEGKLKASKKKGKKVNMKVVRRFNKDTRTIPLLVYSVERYDLQILHLAKKTKTDLFVGTRLSAPRDFRIEINEIKKAMQNTEPSDSPSNDSRNRSADADESRASTSALGRRKRKAPAPEVENED